MCSAMECYLDDMVDCLEDFVKKSLIVVTTALGLIVGILLYVVKVLHDRSDSSEATRNDTEILRQRIQSQDMRVINKAQTRSCGQGVLSDSECIIERKKLPGRHTHCVPQPSHSEISMTKKKKRQVKKIKIEENDEHEKTTSTVNPNDKISENKIRKSSKNENKKVTHKKVEIIDSQKTVSSEPTSNETLPSANSEKFLDSFGYSNFSKNCGGENKNSSTSDLIRKTDDVTSSPKLGFCPCSTEITSCCPKCCEDNDKYSNTSVAAESSKISTL